MNLFIDFFQPSVGLIFETEIWPMMLFQCKRKGVPLLLMNARLSNRSLDKYLLFKDFTSNMLSKFDYFIVPLGKWHQIINPFGVIEGKNGILEKVVLGDINSNSKYASYETNCTSFYRSFYR